jgi:hypothetical protein
MDKRNERLRFANETIEFVVGNPFDPEDCARYVFIKSLDEQAYLFEDEELHRLIDVLGGMSAGEEFFYSQGEVLDMLRAYVSSH